MTSNGGSLEHDRGRGRAGSLLLLETRTDVQQAITWMEGWENFVYDARDHFSLPSVAFSEHLQLPALLGASLCLGGSCMLTVQRQFVTEALGDGTWLSQGFVYGFAVLYAVALYSMLYAGLSDPGQVSVEQAIDIGMGLCDMPLRSHLSWQYKRPIMRFDHYCRWVTNCIGLMNHRTFLLMVICFGLVALLGALTDLSLLALYSGNFHDLQWVQKRWWRLLCVGLHLVYSMIFGYYVLPILRLHVTFISRNELANEWKHDEYYIVLDRAGNKVWVGDLEAEEFNQLFDSFEYDKSRNPWDKSCLTNWRTFLFTSRGTRGQLGEF